ncbi:DEAD/DEAH box helicase [Bacillus sp. HMF5848]|uniref:DEAD/DEAH box helicase n=1 Tax=Bacillus sp. HMF5848 TaxID=2495421 RepID=UPI000F79AA30|nr:DEAD/DEAH box helicase [Bacillus sp. HMF5848]RSK27869.1 DEAD/DEAH box helicase [Bacillus sp. HMF5848]
MSFTSFKLKSYIQEATESFAFKQPTEIQEKIIPIALNGESAVGQSQTGTGKTHAFLLPIFEKLKPERQEVQAVITAPTRELAQQIFTVAEKIAAFSEAPIDVRLFVGGTDRLKTIDKLKKQPHIAIGTPGRINDMAVEQALHVHTATTLVVDEADLMFDLGFIETVDKIAARMPKDLQMLVFSATIPEKLRPFLKKYMENPTYVHIQPNQKSALNIEHVLVPLRTRNKTKLLFNLLNAYNPYLAIVFTNTKQKANEVADALTEQGLKVGLIHGDLPPRERKRVIKQVNELEFQYVVASDLAARGIDIEGVSHVINYELPTDLNFYIHRTGRTGRASMSGVATTVYEPADEDAIVQLEKMGITFSHTDLINGEWKDLGEFNKRSKRKKTEQVDQVAKNLVKRPKKVKPGYKKKMQREVEKLNKKRRRAASNRGKK